jgi:hypothetical protein
LGDEKKTACAYGFLPFRGSELIPRTLLGSGVSSFLKISFTPLGASFNRKKTWFGV